MALLLETGVNLKRQRVQVKKRVSCSFSVFYSFHKSILTFFFSLPHVHCPNSYHNLSPDEHLFLLSVFAIYRNTAPFSKVHIHKRHCFESAFG